MLESDSVAPRVFTRWETCQKVLQGSSGELHGLPFLPPRPAREIFELRSAGETPCAAPPSTSKMSLAYIVGGDQAWMLTRCAEEGCIYRSLPRIPAVPHGFLARPPRTLPATPDTQHRTRSGHDPGPCIFLRELLRGVRMVEPCPLLTFSGLQGGLVGEEAAVSTMMLSYGCMGLVTLLWSWIGVREAGDATRRRPSPRFSSAPSSPASKRSTACLLARACRRGSSAMMRMAR